MTRIDVTQEDLNEGLCGNPRACAVARAIQRVLKGGDHDPLSSECLEAIVGCYSFDIYNGNGLLLTTVDLPVEARQLISQFDLPVLRPRCRPISFELDIPTELLR